MPVRRRCLIPHSYVSMRRTRGLAEVIPRRRVEISCGSDAETGGAGGIRTLDRALQPYNGLANRRLQPLGHSSVKADMPDAGPSRKRADSGRRIPAHLVTPGRLIQVQANPLNLSRMGRLRLAQAACGFGRRAFSGFFIDATLIRRFDCGAVLVWRARESPRCDSRKCDRTAFSRGNARSGCFLLRKRAESVSITEYRFDHGI